MRKMDQRNEIFAYGGNAAIALLLSMALLAEEFSEGGEKNAGVCIVGLFFLTVAVIFIIAAARVNVAIKEGSRFTIADLQQAKRGLSNFLRKNPGLSEATRAQKERFSEQFKVADRLYKEWRMGQDSSMTDDTPLPPHIHECLRIACRDLEYAGGRRNFLNWQEKER